MKGDLEFLNITFALLIFLGTVVFIVLMVLGNIVSFSGGVTTDINTIKAIEASHMVEQCLTTVDEGDSNYIAAEVLDRYGNKYGLKEVCGIEKPVINAEVVDMETYRAWGFKTAVQEPDHETWVSILYVDKTTGERTVNMGKLYVEI
jgi:hypothetical protein